MVQLYQGGREQIKYEYREGTVEEITDNVAARISEIGIVYFAEAQMPCFQHIMWHKKLEFYKLALRGICVYVGENHPLYERESIRFPELKGMKFVTETEDFFAMEHHIERISVGAFISEQHMNDRFYTNSDYMINNLLLHSDVCCLGIDIVRSRQVTGNTESKHLKSRTVSHSWHSGLWRRRMPRCLRRQSSIWGN